MSPLITTDLEPSMCSLASTDTICYPLICQSGMALRARDGFGHQSLADPHSQGKSSCAPRECCFALPHISCRWMRTVPLVLSLISQHRPLSPLIARTPVFHSLSPSLPFIPLPLPLLVRICYPLLSFPHRLMYPITERTGRTLVRLFSPACRDSSVPVTRGSGRRGCYRPTLWNAAWQAGLHA